MWANAQRDGRPTYQTQMSTPGERMRGAHPPQCIRTWKSQHLIFVLFTRQRYGGITSTAPSKVLEDGSFNTVVKPIWQLVECLFTRYSRLSNRFDNRLYSVNGVWENAPEGREPFLYSRSPTTSVPSIVNQQSKHMQRMYDADIPRSQRHDVKLW